MSGDTLPSKPPPSTLRVPRLFDSQATPLSLLSPSSAPLSVQSQQVREAWEPGARPAGRQQQPALLQPSLPKALTVHVSPLPGAGCPQAAVCLAPIHHPGALRQRGCWTLPVSGKVTFGQQCLLKAEGGSGMEVDPKDPVPSKGLVAANLASVIAL